MTVAKVAQESIGVMMVDGYEMDDGLVDGGLVDGRFVDGRLVDDGLVNKELVSDGLVVTVPADNLGAGHRVRVKLAETSQ